MFFGGLVAGKSAAKKTEKIYVLFFLNLYFLQGWPRENRRQKNWKNIRYIVLNILFWRAGRKKIGGKKNWKNIIFICLKLIFFGGLVAVHSAPQKLFFELIFFGGPVAGKVAAKRMKKNIYKFYVFKT